jgi:carboxypeptidase Ss1
MGVSASVVDGILQLSLNSQDEDELVSVRRRLHEHPELSYKEFKTARFVADRLKSLGLEVNEGVGGTGVVALLKGKGGGKVVALRADMDALPMEERTDEPFKSKVKEAMHACGHDTHMAMLLGAARILVDHKDELMGSVKFIFQPAEEAGGRGGAEPMIEDGAMKNPKVDFVFGLHIWAGLPSKVFGMKQGSFMASSDFFKIRIVGRGGHGSAPHETVDPIFVAANVIEAINGIAARMTDPIEPLVISVCTVHSGTKNNIIPDDALLEGTIRTLDEKTRNRVLKLTRRVVKSVCASFGASCEIGFMPNANPVTYNDPRTTSRAFEILKKLKGTKTVEMKPVLAGEDFSRFLQVAPGTFYFLGTRNPAKGCVYPNHNSKFKVDEGVLKYGAESLANLAFEFTKAG